MRYLILILFLVGCESYSPRPSKTSEAIHEQTGVKTASIREEVTTVDKIVEKAIIEDDTSGLPAVKPHTDQVRTDSIIVDSLVLDLVNDCNMWKDRAIKAEAKVDKYHKWVDMFYMFAPLAIGIISIIIGRLTNDPKDTMFGAGAIVAGIIISTNYEIIGKWGLYSIVIAVVIWIIIQQEKRSKKLDEIKDDANND